VSTSTYAELKAQADALLAQAEEIRRAEKAKIIAEIRAKMAEYDIEPSELAKSRGAAKSAKSQPKFRGPNGETWAGGPGRKPEWVRKILAEGDDLEKYRVA